MPGKIWYWVAAAVFLAGVAGAALFLIPRLADLEARLVQVVVPGSTDLDLAEIGTYTIFHESHSVVGGTIYHVEDVSGLTVSLAALPDLTPVPLEQTGANGSYSFASRSGVSVLAFEIAAPGQYRMTAAYDDGRAEPRTVLAVGHGFVAHLLKSIFGTIGIGFTAIGAAVAIWVVTLLKRRKALAAAAGGPGRA